MCWDPDFEKACGRAFLDKAEQDLARSFEWECFVHEFRLQKHEIVIPWLYEEGLKAISDDFDDRFLKLARVYHEGMKKYAQIDELVPRGHHPARLVTTEGKWLLNHSWFYKGCGICLRRELSKYPEMKDIVRHQKIIRSSQKNSTLDSWEARYREEAEITKAKSPSEVVIAAIRAYVQKEKERLEKGSQDGLARQRGSAGQVRAPIDKGDCTRPSVIDGPSKVALSGAGARPLGTEEGPRDDGPSRGDESDTSIRNNEFNTIKTRVAQEDARERAVGMIGTRELEQPILEREKDKAAPNEQATDHASDKKLSKPTFRPVTTSAPSVRDQEGSSINVKRKVEIDIDNNTPPAGDDVSSSELKQALASAEEAENEWNANEERARIAQDKLSECQEKLGEAKANLAMWKERAKQCEADVMKRNLIRIQSAAKRSRALLALERAKLPIGHAEFIDAALLLDSFDASQTSYLLACLKAQKVASAVGVNILEKHFGNKKRPAKVAKVRENGDVTTGGQVDQ